MTGFRRTVLGFLLAPAVAVALLGLGASPASASPIDEFVTVTVEPSSSSAVLGESLDLRINVANTSDGPTPPLVIHLDITDPTDSASVDPEDWTSTLSKPIGVIDARGEASVDWTIQPISGGEFLVYVVALSPGVESLASSNVSPVTVVAKRSLNPGGILPVAIGAPLLIAVALAVQMRYARRTSVVVSSVGAS